MARTKKTKSAAPESVQDARDEQGMSQGIQDAVTAPAAPDAAQGTSSGCAGQLSRQPAAAQDLAELSEELLTGYAVTGCDALNLREGPSLDAPIVAVLPRGAGVFAEEDPEDGWLHVRTGRLEGWMLAKSLEKLPLPELSACEPE